MYNSVSQVKIAVSKSLLKEYKQHDGSNRVVYMSNGTEFQIQLFNPKTTEIACRVYINDEAMSNDIVLRPGERLWLERFLDRPQKFLFETYTVDGNDSVAQQAIKNNGTIRVQFFDKRIRQKQDGLILDHYNYPFSTTLKEDISTGDRLWTEPSISCQTVTCYNCSTTATSETDSIETGRVAEGSYSQQAFDTVNMDFESWCYSEEVIKILPSSQKPVHKEDLQKRYCSQCGRKVVERYKFCPFCGAKL